MPPGSLVYTGERTKEKVDITVLDYNKSRFVEKKLKNPKECVKFKKTGTVTWINVSGVHKVDIVKDITELYKLHPLVQEDILNPDQRPKVEYYKDYVYIVLKMLHLENQKIITEQLSIILGRHYLLSFQESKDIFDPVRERIRKAKGNIRKKGTDYLTYSLLDSVVDNYFIVLEKLGERIEFLEDEVITQPKTLDALQRFKREMILLRKSVWPLREVIGSLERRESTIIQEDTSIFLRDVYDHVVYIMDTIETYRDILAGMLEVYLSSISNRINDVMRFLTIIGTIFMPLTFIVGIYGMNFRYMPELYSVWGYPLVMLFMIIIAVINHLLRVLYCRICIMR